jgi:hypothetical protein
MKRNLYLSSGLLLALLLLAVPGEGQKRDPAQADFPPNLLDGITAFNLGIFLEGDLRGNFAPCG